MKQKRIGERLSVLLLCASALPAFAGGNPSGPPLSSRGLLLGRLTSVWSSSGINGSLIHPYGASSEADLSGYHYEQAAALNPCDLNGDGVVDDTDVQLALDMDVGLIPCTANIVGLDVCNIVVVQRVVNADLDGVCVTATHSVSLSWNASTSPNVVGYNIYRSTTSGTSYVQLNPALVSTTSYTDYNVQAGQTYYYVATSVDNNSNEGSYSNQAQAVIPIP